MTDLAPLRRFHRSRRTLSAQLAVLITAGACASAVASGGPGQGSQYIKPPPEPKACHVDKRPVVAQGRANRKDELCGSRQGDRFRTSGGGDSVWGFEGNDTVAARDGRPDEIWGGPGRGDTGVFDECDRIHGIERARVSGACPHVKGGGRRYFASESLPYFPPVVECFVSDGTRFVFFLFEPQVRALDVTNRVDFQTVAWLPVLTTTDGGELEIVEKGDWYWDRIFDEQVDERTINEWRRFGDKPREWIFFTVDAPGTYEVGVVYQWYRTADAPERQHIGFPRTYYGENARGDSCTFD